MPLQLRSQVSVAPPSASEPEPETPPKKQVPRLLPLSFPAPRQPPAQKHRRSRSALLLFVASVILCIPIVRRLNRPKFSLSSTHFTHLNNKFNNVSTIADDVTNDDISPDDESSEESAVKPRPRTVLVVAAHGGIGNQVYFIAEALFMARHAKLDVVVPTIGPRNFGPYSSLNTPEVPGREFWNVGVMSHALDADGRVLGSLPKSCQGRFDAVYLASRSPQRAKPGTLYASSRAVQTACFLAREVDWDDQEAPFTNWDECPQKIFDDALIERRSLPISDPPDQYFLDELASLQTAQTLPSGRTDPGRPACVLVDGHAFNRKGHEAHEYLYSFLHYVEPTPRIAKMIGNWTMANLAVLHLRHDELECRTDKKMVGRLCIRVSMNTGRPESVYWAEVKEVADAVVKAMQSAEVKALYIASSPYVPKEELEQFRTAIGTRVRIAQKVNFRLSHNDQNFAERELATHAKCFIGEFSSTWSGTVYYKRRTLGKKTLWSNVLLGRDTELGYYKYQDPIPPPGDYEAKDAAFGM